MLLLGVILYFSLSQLYKRAACRFWSFLIWVLKKRREDIIILDMSIAEGMKMIISGGAVTPKADYGNTENRSDTFKKEGL